MSEVSFTGIGVRRGAATSFGFALGVVPFGLVCGITAQGAGLSFVEIELMSAFVYAGSAQLVALAIWSHPPALLSVTLAAFVVNLRLALMGPVLSPWLDRLRGWRLWGSLFVMADQNWGLSVTEMNAGGRDAGFLLGSGLALWGTWLVSTGVGHVMGAQLRPAPGHPLFFAALAVFVSILTQMFRGRVDVVPWVIAAAVSIVMAQLLPGTFWYIVAGALAGSVAGGLRDMRR